MESYEYPALAPTDPRKGDRACLPRNSTPSGCPWKKPLAKPSLNLPPSLPSQQRKQPAALHRGRQRSDSPAQASLRKQVRWQKGKMESVQTRGKETR